MRLRYRVLSADNKPRSMERALNDLAERGWMLVSTCAVGSRIYMFFEMESEK